MSVTERLQQLESLLTLARQVLAADDDDTDALVDSFELYGAAFDACGIQEQAPDFSDAELAVLKELSLVHEQVLLKAGKLLQGTSGDIKEFRKKAKGIISYVDTLPRKISVTRLRKG